MSFICSFTFALPNSLLATFPLGSLPFRVPRSTSILRGHFQFSSPWVSPCISFSHAFSVSSSIFLSSGIFILFPSYFLFYSFPISIFLSMGGGNSQIFFSSIVNVHRPRRYHLCFVFQTISMAFFFPSDRYFFAERNIFRNRTSQLINIEKRILLCCSFNVFYLGKYITQIFGRIKKKNLGLPGGLLLWFVWSY